MEYSVIVSQTDLQIGASAIASLQVLMYVSQTFCNIDAFLVKPNYLNICDENQ
jgi:hypothetical protein